MFRRDFLKFAGSYVVSAAVPGSLSGCLHNQYQPEYSVQFPQGVASGDPHADSVVLWTRVQVEAIELDAIPVMVEVAIDRAFTQLVVQQYVSAEKRSDFCLRVIVNALQADQIYFYRFRVADRDISPVGRTWTAPDGDSIADIHFAFVSCQDRNHGFYSAYRRMLLDDLDKPVGQKLRFVLHLGDFIYETINDPLQQAIDSAHQPLPNGLRDWQGNPRTVSAFPDGQSTDDGRQFAQSLEDYRHLYKQFLSDPDIQAARARWPFVCVWDDHEFSDDCWQTESNYRDRGVNSSTDEPSQPRKVAANQAWYEYTPVNLTELSDIDRDLRHAHAFQFADVGVTPNGAVDQDNLANNDDNLAAIASLTIYRSLRFGANLALVLTDNRSYRSDHAVPEDISGNFPAFYHPRLAMPVALVNELDAGFRANDGHARRLIFIDRFLANPRADRPPGTMLGSKQKQWWKQTLSRSDARWKVWGNSVPLLHLLINLSALPESLPDLILSADSWDGYHTERNELMQYLQAEEIKNVVSLSGDLHAHFIGSVLNQHEPDASELTPSTSLVEVVCGAISSTSQFAAVERLTRRADLSLEEQQLRSLITYDARETTVFEDNALVNNLNNTLINGVSAGLAAAQSHDLSQIQAAKDPAVNEHLLYADTDAHGYGVVHVAAEKMDVTLVTMRSINQDPNIQDNAVLRTTQVQIPWVAPGESTTVSSPEITGVAPFPWNLNP